MITLKIWFSMKVKVLVAQLCPILMTWWTVAHKAPLSMRFSRQEYWSGLSFPSPEDLLDPGTKPRSPESQADSLPSKTPGKPYAEIISTKIVNNPQTHPLQR